MASKEKVLLCWSGGKDSALTVAQIQRAGRYEIVALLTNITSDYDRVSMHGIPTSLLERQAESLGYPLEKVFIKAGADNAEYEARMSELLLSYRSRGVRDVAFGDLFLQDVRQYREDNLAKINMRAVFPLWLKPTSQLAKDFVDAGFRAVITSVDSEKLDGKFAGRQFDEKFLADLPAGVDPCGENGEFHSFVYDGPIFSRPIGHRLGQTVVRENRFYFTDLVSITP